MEGDVDYVSEAEGLTDQALSSGLPLECPLRNRRRGVIVGLCNDLHSIRGASMPVVSLRALRTAAAIVTLTAATRTGQPQPARGDE